MFFFPQRIPFHNIQLMPTTGPWILNTSRIPIRISDLRIAVDLCNVGYKGVSKNYPDIFRPDRALTQKIEDTSGITPLVVVP